MLVSRPVDIELCVPPVLPKRNWCVTCNQSIKQNTAWRQRKLSVFKMHPTPAIHYPISHSQGTIRFTVYIKPWSVCHSWKSLGKQKNKIDEINKWNNPSHTVLERYIFTHESQKFITLSAYSIPHNHILSCILLSCLYSITMLAMHKTGIRVLMVSCLNSMVKGDEISIKKEIKYVRVVFLCGWKKMSRVSVQHYFTDEKTGHELVTKLLRGSIYCCLQGELPEL